MSKLLTFVVDKAAGELERKSKAASYFSDPVAWAEYMLGVRLWSKQREVAQSVVDNKSVAIKAGHGTGKMVGRLTEHVTPTGWVKTQDIAVGDQLYDEVGNITRVVALSPWWEQRMYRITFDDGASIDAGENHEWNVLDLSRRTSAMKQGISDWRDHWDTSTIYTTQGLFDAGVTTNSGQRRWRIPLSQALQTPDADLPIDPYVLGFWLGDGTASTGEITIGETKIGLLRWLENNGYAYKLRANWSRGRATVTPTGLKIALRDLGLLGNKHIPMAYLRASEAQRRELLAGLMDSDGFLLYAQGGAGVGIDLTHKRLSSDLYELLMTLGCKVRRNTGVAAYTLDGIRHVTGTRYRLNWTPLSNPFKIRGQEWCESVKQRSRHTQRTIVSIEYIGRDTSRCIQVDSPRHLYLTGRELIPTHNSFLVAVLVCWWIDTRYPNVYVATTAPSNAQINAIVWREIRKMKDSIEERYKDGNGVIDHKLPGYITSDAQWKMPGGVILGFGRKPPEEKEESAFQGLHDGYVLAIGDESCGLTGELIDALGNITSNEHSRRILIANPTNPASYFGKLFKEKTKSWVYHTISVFDSPNFTGEKKDMSQDALDKLVGPQYVEDKRSEFGESSARYKARVLGEFAYDDDNTLIQPEDIEMAVATDIRPDYDGRPVLGVDVARMGEDRSVVYRNDNGKIRFMDMWSKSTTTETANRVHRIAVDIGAGVVFVDSDGVGGGVKDQLVQMCGNAYIVMEVHGAGASPDRRQWHNFRAYAWDNFRLRCTQGHIDLDAQDEDLHDELLPVRFFFNKQSGGLVIESKEDMKDRGIRSPDLADAAIYASIEFDMDDPLLGMNKGDKFRTSPEDVIGEGNMPKYLLVMREL